MKKTRIAALVAGTALAALSVGCGDAANTNTANANRVNSNTAVVVNSNNANVANVNTSSSAYNRNYNARGDYERDANTYRAEAKNKGESIGQGLEDGWIHLKVRGALAAVDDLRDSTINVDVDNNVVTLRGSVANAASKRAAEDAAKKVDGVKSVSNKLEVRPDGSSNRGGNANAANANAKKK